MSRKFYAMVYWTPDDVKRFAPKWSAERCKEFLQRHEAAIRDAQLTIGNETIQDLVNFELEKENGHEE